jgi:hypothetical protein
VAREIKLIVFILDLSPDLIERERHIATICQLKGKRIGIVGRLLYISLSGCKFKKFNLV